MSSSPSIKTSGIYKIVNKVNGKYYLGSTSNTQLRWNLHRSELRRNRHGNDYLQHAWNKYGESTFDFIVVEKAPAEKLIEIEQRYLNELDRDKCYNLSFTADRIEMSEATRKKLSESHKGKKNANYGKRMSAELKQKLLKANKGIKHTADHKQKISNSILGEKNPMFGKHHSEETKQKLREARLRAVNR